MRRIEHDINIEGFFTASNPKILIVKTPSLLLVILALTTSRTVCQVPPPAQHIYNRTKTELAGVSGYIEFKDICDLTLTNFATLSKNNTGKYSIPGISGQVSCEEAAQLTINNNPYCVNGSVTDTLVKLAGGEMRFVLNSAWPETFTLGYYKGIS